MRSAWFGTARATPDGLWQPGTPRGHAADLRLRPDGITLVAGEARDVLAWGAYGRGGDDGWWIGEFAVGRGHPIGVAIHVNGAAAEAVASVRAATRTFRNRVARVLEDGTVVPLKAEMFVAQYQSAEHDTLDALCAVLAADPVARERLLDGRRVGRLIRDLADDVLPAVPERFGARRRTVEVLTAMRVLGLRHTFGGRPLRRVDKDSPPVLVDRVIASIDANPYTQGVEVPRELVEELVRRHYVDVAPWPFAALLN